MVDDNKLVKPARCEACEAKLPMIWNVQSRKYEHIRGLATFECKTETFDSAQRAREKAESRLRDQQRLDSGEVTGEQLRKENSSFGFPPDRVRLTYPKKEK